MNSRIKKVLSLLLTVAIVASFAVVPAYAEGGSNVTIKLAPTSFDASGACEVEAYIESDGGSDFEAATIQFDVAYDENLLACETAASALSGAVVNTDIAGSIIYAWSGGADNQTSTSGKLSVMTFTLKTKANIESQPSALSIETPSSGLIVSYNNESFEEVQHTVSKGAANINVPGMAPAVTKLTLSPDAVEVNGGSSTSVTVTAAKADDTTVSLSDSELKVSPSGEGVTVSGGALVVDGKAKAGTYIVSVNNGNPASTATAELTVTRAPAETASVEIDGSGTIALSNEDGNVYSAAVKDQYGDEVITDVTWTLTGADVDVAALSGTTGKSVTVTLKDAAEEGDTFTLTAEAGGKSNSVNIRVVQGTIYAKAERWTGDDGSRIYLAIEDIDHANNIRDLYLDDLLPSRVSVTYPGGETDYSSQYRVKWSSTRLWDLFKDLRSDWSKMSGNKGYYVVPNLGYYIESDGTEDTPVVIDYSGWFSLIIDEGSAESNGWYEEENTYVPPVASANFTDVAAGYWAADDINWCYAKNVMLGNSATTFNPTGVTSRQQLWMVLARVNGSAPDSMATARTWAINMGVSDGTNVSGSLTRQQMVAMLYRYSAIKGYSGKIGGSLSAFSDAGSVSSYARDAMSWAVANGIITGNDGRLNPNGTATRAQFAAIMHRFCDTFKVI